MLPPATRSGRVADRRGRSWGIVMRVMVPFAEPWFTGLHADVGIIPVMSGDDVQKGIGKLG
jgi:hypothetical protein